MLNKKVLLGTLVAGALLLPQAASAGVVSGACVNCHTMHGTDGSGVSIGTNAQLTKGDSCAGCHATGGGNDAATGMKTIGTFDAPQVDDTTNPGNGGYFTTAAGDSAVKSQQQHNVPTSIAGMSAEIVLSPPNPPGGVAGNANTTCTGCHTNASGGHHGTTTTDSYRMLNFTASAGTGGASLYGGGAATTNAVAEASILPNASTVTYDADGMNDVCGTCHPDFHGTDGATGQYSGSAWIRHPTDLVLGDNYALNATYNYQANYDLAAELDLLPLGTSDSSINGTGGANTLMCITCHYSHGGPYADLLRFDYTGQVAGAGGQVPGCESCHSYGGATPTGM